MRRICDGCGTRLEGRRRHGFVKGPKIVCGRKERERMVQTSFGKDLRMVPTPECSW